MKKPLTPVELVYIDTEVARTAKAKKEKVRLGWNTKELAADMLLVAEALVIDLKKYIAKGMGSPAKRVRRGTKAMEVLGTEFRVQSVKEKKHGKDR